MILGIKGCDKCKGMTVLVLDEYEVKAISCINCGKISYLKDKIFVSHIGTDTIYKCRLCMHHHCLECRESINGSVLDKHLNSPLCHRCGCKDYKRLPRSR
jgi:hypothetical protein